ncbi:MULTISPECIES: polysaccharide pyruvyl transferase family protein [unclassified Rhodococcus (in: high G+C Gram-positive bacteria)]|uniref:polysaccharide pyruvyl transferase family protein n=1 Tax=unclassified Rhodococcus (in: high G+C Gram-positive bacteria) TaxID=192944 RepID=UPI003396830C
MTVVTVAYNSGDVLEKCICSIVDDDDIGTIIVIDNSTDHHQRARTKSIADKYDVQYKSNPTNLGFGVAVNTAILDANLDNDDLIWILNPDTEVDAGAVAGLVDAVVNRTCEIVSPLITTGVDRDRLWFAGGEIDVNRRSVRHPGIGLPLTEIPTLTRINFITGAAMMMSASTWRRLGGFDPKIFLYWEDVDLCIRAQKLGIRMAVVPNSVVWHAVGASSAAEGKSEIYYYSMQRNRVIVMGRYYGRFSTIFGPGAIETARIFARAAKESKGRASKLRAAVRGYGAGCRESLKSRHSRNKKPAVSRFEAPTRVLALWADSHSANLGVRVLAEGAESLAKVTWGGDVEVVCQDFGSGSTGVSLGARSIMKDIGRSRGPIKEHFRSFDAAFDTGAGDSFTDIYGYKRLLTIIYSQRLLKRLGIPSVMLPQTIGPFKSRTGRLLARGALANFDCVLSRDAVSAQCAESLGREVDGISTDLVFMLVNPSESVQSDVLVNVSGLLWHENSHVNYVDYRGFVRELIDGLIVAERQITLIAHVLDSPREDNDVPVLRLLAEEYQSVGVTAVIPTSLDSARSIISGANILIGSRMHACLNALSVGTPAIAWAYSRKFEPLMAALEWRAVLDLKLSDDIANDTLQLVSQLQDLPYPVAAVQARARDFSKVAMGEIAKRWHTV